MLAPFGIILPHFPFKAPNHCGRITWQKGAPLYFSVPISPLLRMAVDIFEEGLFVFI